MTEERVLAGLYHYNKYREVRGEFSDRICEILYNSIKAPGETKEEFVKKYHFYPDLNDFDADGETFKVRVYVDNLYCANSLELEFEKKWLWEDSYNKSNMKEIIDTFILSKVREYLNSYFDSMKEYTGKLNLTNELYKMAKE